MDEKQRHEAGMNIRRAVLGDAHVDRAIENTTDFNRDFQEFLTRYAWGDVWSRPGLDRKTRSMITVAMLIALKNEDELRMHLRAARANGVSLDELKEILLHSGLYCGLPAANQAFHIASEIVGQS